MIFEGILLTCFNNIKTERTSSSIYHLLKGKKSIQTVQDAHIYQLGRFYGIHKHLTRTDFDMRIKELVKQKLLEKCSERELCYFTTPIVTSWMIENKTNTFFNGLRYHEKADIFADRLLLLIQTLTNSKYNNFSFIPVIDHSKVEYWVKQFYRRIKGKEALFLQKIHDELFLLLSQFSTKEAEIFVDRLTGYKSYGMSLFQLAEKQQISVDDVYLIITSNFHYIIHRLEHEQTVFPFLSLFIEDLSSLAQITHSANETYQYLCKGVSVEEIARIRRLKINTIYDHIVEIALYQEDFPIRNYVSIHHQKEIWRAIEKAESFKLKDIKDLVSDQISYFQIRLVLTLKNKLQKQGDESESSHNT